MSKKVTVTKNYIDSLKFSIKELKDENRKIKEDREKFRIFCLTLLKDNVSMTSKNQYYSPETMITRLSRLMNMVDTWYWGQI